MVGRIISRIRLTSAKVLVEIEAELVDSQLVGVVLLGELKIMLLGASFL